jgi:dipeptidyl aminopeptidase/acylaminoacyl peptidase
MTLPRVFSWRSLRIVALSVVALAGLVIIGLALWGLPAPPALTVEEGPRVSWKWVWQGMRMVQRFQASRRFAGWLPGESGLLVHVGTPGAVHVVERSGATPARLAGLPERASHVVQSRFTERPYFVFSLDDGGSERYIHYIFDLERRTYEPLTDRPARSYVGAFDGEGRHVIYASAKRNGTDVDLYVVDVTNPASDTRVLEAGGDYAPGSLSPDGRSVFVNRYLSHSSSQVQLLDLDTRATRPLFDGAPVGVADATWGRDGRTLYLATDVDREFVGVHALDRASGETTLLTGDLDWDVEGVEELADGRMLALLVNEDARGTLYLLDLTSGGLRKVGGAPAGHIERMVAHPRLARLALDVVSPMGVSGVWTYDVATDRFSPWAVQEEDAEELPPPITVRYPTFDMVEGGERRMIPALIFASAPEFTGPRPVMIDIHGGPAWQTRAVAAPPYELIRRMGITIVAPNVRGSTGYGKSYAALDDRERREDAVRDIGALLDWIATQPDLDAARVMVAGGSYGGYMTLAALVHYSDRVRCGIELFGISDLVTYLQASEDGHFPEAQRAEFGDERDPAMRAVLESISPARHAERIRVPLLIYQGANDVRVKAQESRQMVERIRAAGGTVTYVEAADEGHTIDQPLNQLYFGSLMSEFTSRCLVR